MREIPFGENQQRQSRYDGGLEEDGITHRDYVPLVPPEPPAHVARETRRANHSRQAPRNAYREVPLTGCQLCIAPHYLLPHSFGLPLQLGEEGDIHDVDSHKQLALPWMFDPVTGELRHFLANSSNDIATPAHFDADARVFEPCFSRDVRFLHHHNHTHDCGATCIKT